MRYIIPRALWTGYGRCKGCILSRIFLLRGDDGHSYGRAWLCGSGCSCLHAYGLSIFHVQIHANIRWPLNRVSQFSATPRFHHWHHGIMSVRAINVNFAIHFPFLDRLFGTYFMPSDRWPAGYGIKGHPVPLHYVAQFLYPLKRKQLANNLESQNLSGYSSPESILFLYAIKAA